MNLSYFYRRAALYTSLVVILVTIVVTIAINYDYKSEWMTAETVIVLSTGYAFVYCAIISALSLTIFLNSYPAVKRNIILNALSWFLLPVAFITTVLVNQISYLIRYEAKFDEEPAYILILNLPFLFSLTWTYIKFRRSNYTK